MRSIFLLCIGLVIAISAFEFWLRTSEQSVDILEYGEELVSTETYLPITSDNKNHIPNQTVRPTLDEESSQQDFLDQQTQQIEDHLRTGRFQEAIILFDSIYPHLSGNGLSVLRQAIFSYVDELVKQENLIAGESLLSLYVSSNSQDIEAIDQLALVRHQLGNYSGETEALLLLISLASQVDQRDGFERRLVQSTAKLTQSRVRKFEYYQAILKRQNNLPMIELALARALLEVKRTSEAEVIINKYKWDSQFQEQISNLRSDLDSINSEQKNRKHHTISLSTTHNGYILNAILNGSTPVTLLYKPDAPITLISERKLLEANNTIKKRYDKVLRFGSESISTPIIVLKHIAVGSVATGRLDIALHDEDSLPEVDGILGKNFFLNYRQSLNEANHKLTLSKY